ncbi:CvpA family protein [Marinomonas sp. 15G1-11]|uniref:CvpA family protein n=1 Tax=Marinomonas phaeophyticola TaxID=3004091 RepID=A0ABT4JPU2_9GAMM|nr:CvpA family protein [Marinomonas sp. 15G1-11]MCZ2720364.1 CvpA family protein [Marinomonas sp. 15G1-11]
MEQLGSIATLDWVIFIVILLSSLISLKRGFIKEVFSLITWAMAFAIAVKFSSQLQSLMVDQLQNDQVRYIASFLILFISSLCVGALISYLLGSLVQVTGLSSTDRILGMIFGFARGSLIVVAVISLLSLSTSFTENEFWQESKLTPRLVLLKDWAREMLGKSEGLIDPTLIDRALES